MFPLELFNLISLHCKPCFFSLNKELHLLYNDEWFQNKLQMLFPGRKLFTITNYKDLYKKYLSETNIYYNYYRSEKDPSLSDLRSFETKGIKVQYRGAIGYDYFKYDQILTFNGELYIEADNGTYLIDTKVIDISSYLYVKENGIYSNYCDTSKLVNSDISGCKQIINQSEDDTMWILTNNGIYSINTNTNFYQINNCVKMCLQLHNIYVSDINNNIYRICSNQLSKLNYTFDMDCYNKTKLKDGSIMYTYDDDDYNFSNRSYYHPI